MLQYSEEFTALEDLWKQYQGQHLRVWLDAFLAVNSSDHPFARGHINSWSSQDRNQYSRALEQVLNDVARQPNAPKEVWVSLGGPVNTGRPTHVFDTLLYHVGVTS